MSVASAQTKLTIGYAAVSPRTTPLYLAQEQGLCAKYDLDPKIVLVRAAATLVATLVSGEMDVGYTGATSVLGAAGQGSYLKILSLSGVERRPIPMVNGMHNIRRLLATLNPKIAGVKVEKLIDSRLIRKLDENGFIDKMAANYGVK